MAALGSAQARALALAMSYIERGWTQGAYCRNSFGSAVATDSQAVRRVDLSWALDRAAQECRLPEAELRGLVQAQLPRAYRDSLWGIEQWNDVRWRTRTEIIIVLERTIQELGR